MRSKKCQVLLTVLLAGAVLTAGCAKDPQIMVTPFVLKAETPPEMEVSSAADLAPCSKPYEDVVTNSPTNNNP